MLKDLHCLWCLSLAFLACGDNDKASVRAAEGAKPKWTGLAVNWNRYDIYIEPDKDTIFWFDDTRRVIEMEGRDSTSGRLYKATLGITPASKDSILALATEIVVDAVQTNDWVTCYAGDNVRIKLTSGATALSLSYGSVTNWLALSPKHSRFKAMTFDRFDSVPKALVEFRFP